MQTSTVRFTIDRFPTATARCADHLALGLVDQLSAALPSRYTEVATHLADLARRERDRLRLEGTPDPACYVCHSNTEEEN